MPAGTVQHDQGVFFRRQVPAEVRQVGVHGIGVYIGQQAAVRSSIARTDSPKQVHPLELHLANGLGPLAAVGPDAGGGSLLPKASLVLKPDSQAFVRMECGRAESPILQRVFLKSSCESLSVCG